MSTQRPHSLTSSPAHVSQQTAALPVNQIQPCPCLTARLPAHHVVPTHLAACSIDLPQPLDAESIDVVQLMIHIRLPPTGARTYQTRRRLTCTPICRMLHIHITANAHARPSLFVSEMFIVSPAATRSSFRPQRREQKLEKRMGDEKEMTAYGVQLQHATVLCGSIRATYLKFPLLLTQPPAGRSRCTASAYPGLLASFSPSPSEYMPAWLIPLAGRMKGGQRRGSIPSGPRGNHTVWTHSASECVCARV